MERGVENELDPGSHQQFNSGATGSEPLGPTPDLRPLMVALAALGLGYYMAFMRLVRGDLLNSYPFISSDGIEWLVGGLAVSRWFGGVDIPELPQLRNPGFVSVTAVDFQLGADGYFLFAVIAIAIVAALALLLLLARWEGVPPYQAAVVVLVMAVSPVGFSRMWLLSDQLATALLVLGAVALHPYATRGSQRWLAVATVAAGLGGATQLYGLAGFLVAGGWCLIVSVRRRKPDYLLASALVAAPVLTFVLTRLWLAQIPNVAPVRPLGLFEISFNMVGFYANAWGFAFGALLPLLGVLVAYRWREIRASPLLTGYWLAVLAFMGSSFFYQFEDFRFTVPTSLMMGVAIMATLPGERPLPRPRELMAATGVLAVVIGLLLTPRNYVNPKWSTVEINPAKSIVGRLLTAEPKDRFRLALHCDSDQLCAGVPFRIRDSDHARHWFRIYRYLLNADSTTPLALFTEGMYQGWFEARNTNDCCEPDFTVSYGLAGDRPVVGDWDGAPTDLETGTDTPGVFRSGVWLLRNSSDAGPADVELEFGEAGQAPVVGDWDGDGIDSIGVFEDGVWRLRNSNTTGPPDLQFEFGQSGDVPVTGDWDGDGVETIGVYRGGEWLLRNSNSAGPPDVQLKFGQEGDRPVTGDWEGDGIDTIGLFKDGVWKLRGTNAGGPADLSFSFGVFAADLPITGDWDNSGMDSVGVAR